MPVGEAIFHFLSQAAGPARNLSNARVDVGIVNSRRARDFTATDRSEAFAKNSAQT